MSDPTCFAPSFQIHNLFAAATTHGLTPAMWAERIQSKVNHPTWILAHLNGIRRGIARNLGATVTESDAPAPDFGDPCLAADQYPTPAALLSEFSELGTTIATRLREIDASILQRTFEPTFPDGQDRSIGDALSFLIAHEALHLGQLSAIRRLHDLPGMAEVALEMMRG
ncbi:MAG: DinB family protein [Planctomycetes bacterium]|nr:DinB family protein [Planctomycetota bacterium]